MGLTRRRFLLSGAAFCAVPAALAAGAAEPGGRTLSAAPSRTRLLGPDRPETAVWAYDGAVPGPVLRARRGDPIRVRFANRLPQPTTVHWHGLRVPNGMDGVPDLTQPAVAPGGEFHYAFTARNSGTFWYHPHFRTGEQQDRGLHGVIVVADDAPLPVDRDLVWALDDWRLRPDGRIVEDFGNLHDASHQGRFGNTATVNGRVPPDLPVRRGERVRLRLVNVANAWIFRLRFTGHAPAVIAYDGHAVLPHPPPGGLVTVGPAQRVDLVLDLTGRPGQRYEVTDQVRPGRAYKLLDLVYGDDPLRNAPPGGAVALPPPDLPAPDLARTEPHRIRFEGGAMGGLRGARFRGRETGIRELARAGKVWAVNGVVAASNTEPPVLDLALGKTHVIEFANDTAFPHPVHLHGHPMRVLDVDGRAPGRPVWRDTLLLAARTRGRVAFVADNPGSWMLHCHIPEHQEAGMMAVVRVG